MQGILRHRPRGALRAMLGLAAAAMLSFGGAASAQTTPASTNCPDEDGIRCYLEVSAPASVVPNQPFTIKVTITNALGTPVPASDPCAANVQVNLTANSWSGDPPTYYASASGGVANFHFPDGFSTPDEYELDIFANQDPYTGCHYHQGQYNVAASPVVAPTLTIADIPPGQAIAPCPDSVSCTQTASGSGSAATLFADTGSFDAFFEPFNGEGCGDRGPRDSNGVLNFNYTADPNASVSEKTIVFALDHATTGIGRYQICWQSPTPFTARDGHVASRAHHDSHHDSHHDWGDQVYVGYLPTCSKDKEEHGTAGAPCVLYKHSGPHNSAFFGILAPPGDPKVYPGTP